MSDVTKLDAARRQLETAIDMFFDQADPLAVYTLAYASFKVLLDIYPHQQGDDFSAQIDALIGKEGWKRMSGQANFLKHADRDFDAVLEDMHPMQPMGVIGFGTLLYRRLAGDFTLKMRAYDFWVEEDGYEELGIEEIDENVERAEAFKEIRDTIRALPVEQRLKVAQSQYRSFIANYDRMNAEVEALQAEGLSFTEAFDAKFKAVRD
ncbi:hypothetical protein DM806_13715 [Sphingobium lactosutens]|uniref:hypothetical protein n=1 Tax=Sphingobium lactosutens TaxID=522773 RepID=UPI0015C0AFCA|nr:hypothetical protein [Sphingobium lactosutens]NWK96698.1 hypothetical protein [Sphingobium lactosutens]